MELEDALSRFTIQYPIIYPTQPVPETANIEEDTSAEAQTSDNSQKSVEPQ